MSNDFYNVSAVPATGSPGASAPIRAEYAAIMAAFEKMPALVGNGGRFVRVKADASGLESVNAFDLTSTPLTLPLGTTPPTSQGRVYWNTSTKKLSVGDGAAALVMVDTASAQALTNKTINAATNTLSNIPNSALVNSSITINGVPLSLGGTASFTANTTQALSFSNAGTGDVSGSTFNGSAARTISYNSVGAPSTTGTNATGTWGINVTGNAGTVTNGVYTTGDQSIAGNKTFTGGVIAQANIRVENVAPIITMVETDQASPAGRRRIVQDGNQFTVRRNTAAGGDFSTEVNDITSDATGNFTASGNVTAFSDERLKIDWNEALPSGRLVDALACVKAGAYTRIDTGDRQVGVSAQSLQRILPEAVLTAPDGTLSVAYGNAAMLAVVALAREVVRLRGLIEG